jgi:hypothetical protein
VNIREKLLQEHSKAVTDQIIGYIGSDRRRFSEFMNIFLNGEPLIRQRGSWPLGYIGAERPVLLKPYYGKLIRMLHSETEHQAVARNILRIFQESGVPEKYEGIIMDYCMRRMMNEFVPIAIRAMTITIASRICSRYKKLGNELLPMLRELQSMPQPPAISQRIKSALKELERGI